MLPGKGPKGIRKRRQSLFQPGHKFWGSASGSKARDQQEQLLEAPDDPQVPEVPTEVKVKVERKACPGLPRRRRFGRVSKLRPLRRFSQHQPEVKNRHRLVLLSFLEHLWNDTIAEHGDGEKFKKCRKPRFTLAREKKWGLVSSQSLRCVNCDFVGPFRKLYEETNMPGKRGRKCAVLNLALTAAVQHTTIGHEKARDLLSAIDLPVPAQSSLQRLSPKVTKAFKEVATEGMNQHLHRVKRRGKRGDSTSLGFDVKYNNIRPMTSHRHGLHQTSQAIALAIAHTPHKADRDSESESEGGNSDQQHDSESDWTDIEEMDLDEIEKTENPIVAADVQNKICVKGAKLRQGGADIQCGVPGKGHDGCTANIHRCESLNEKSAGIRIGKQLAGQGVRARCVTTDGDAQGAKGVEEGQEAPAVKCRDPVHLGRSVAFKGKNITWSPKMFPGKQTQARKTKCAQSLAIDLKNRSKAVADALHEKHSGNIESIKAEAGDTVEAILRCYQGHCDDCGENGRKLLTACSGGRDGDWISKSQVLQHERIDCLFMNLDDISNMRETLNMVLSQESLEKTKYRYNTQLNEAANRSLSASLPKNIKYSINLGGRLACRIEVWNHGPGKALLRGFSKLGLPTSLGQLHHWKLAQHRFRYKKAYNRAAKTIQQRRRNDALLRELKKTWRPQLPPSDYHKHQGNILPDHSYQHVSCLSFLHLYGKIEKKTKNYFS